MEISKGIHDGRTEGLQEIQTRTEALGQTLTVDDFVFQGKALNDRLNRYLRTWKSFPTYRYVINTLKNNMFYHGDDRALELLYEERERGQKLSEASEEALESLCDALIQKVEDLPDKAAALNRKKCDAQFLRCCATSKEDALHRADGKALGQSAPAASQNKNHFFA